MTIIIAHSRGTTSVQYDKATNLSTGPLLLISEGKEKLTLAEVSDIPSSPVIGSTTGWGTTSGSSTGSITSTGAEVEQAIIAQ